MYSLGYRPVMIQRIELGANAGVTLDAITHEAIHVAIRGLPSARDGVVRLAPKAPMRSTRTSARDSILLHRATCAVQAPRPVFMRSNARRTNSRSRSRSIRWTCACGVTRISTQNNGELPFSKICANATAKARRKGAKPFNGVVSFGRLPWRG
jgi:hypothetical protein